jgi:hypothetical protein
LITPSIHTHQILFLGGPFLITGSQKTFYFFARRNKLRGGRLLPRRHPPRLSQVASHRRVRGDVRVSQSFRLRILFFLAVSPSWPLLTCSVAPIQVATIPLRFSLLPLTISSTYLALAIPLLCYLIQVLNHFWREYTLCHWHLYFDSAFGRGWPESNCDDSEVCSWQQKEIVFVHNVFSIRSQLLMFSFSKSRRFRPSIEPPPTPRRKPRLLKDHLLHRSACTTSLFPSVPLVWQI